MEQAKILTYETHALREPKGSLMDLTGKRMRQCQCPLGMTQQGLAIQVCCTKAMIPNRVRRDAAVYDLLLCISQVLGATVRWLTDP